MRGTTSNDNPPVGHRSKSRTRLIVLTVGLGAALLWAWPVHSARQDASRETSEQREEIAVHPSQTAFHLTAEEFQQREAGFSRTLQEYRESYRLAWLIRAEPDRRAHMHALACEIEKQLPSQRNPEFSVWLELLEDSHVAAGDVNAALSATDRRYEHLAANEDGDLLAESLLEEAAFATARRRYDLADGLYDRAEDFALSDEVFAQAVLARGRMMLEDAGVKTAVEYHLETADLYAEEVPALARQAHLAAAHAYHGADQLDAALDVLEDIRTTYPGTREAEVADMLYHGWPPDPWEIVTDELQETHPDVGDTKE